MLALGICLGYVIWAQGKLWRVDMARTLGRTAPPCNRKANPPQPAPLAIRADPA